MKRIESGVYQTDDGRYRVERIDSLGEGWSQARQQFVEVTTSVWVITERDGRGAYDELDGEYASKRAAEIALEDLLEESLADAVHKQREDAAEMIRVRPPGVWKGLGE